MSAGVPSQSDKPLSKANESRLADQLAKLHETDDPERRQQLLEWLQGRGLLGLGDVPVPIALLDDPAGGDQIPVVSGELLAAPPGDPEARDDLVAILAEYGFDDSREERGGRVLRFIATDREGADIPGAIAAAAAYGVGPDHLCALAWRVKGKSGPEHSDYSLGSRPESAAEGSRPLVVVVDTGIADAESRPRDDGWLDDIDGDPDPLDVAEPFDYLDLSAGHGTFVAGVIRQVAPDAQVVVLRALGADGVGTQSGVADKITQAGRIIAELGGRGVINMSLGGTTYNDAEPIALREAIDGVAAMDGVCLVAAAGNFPDNRPYWPAAFDSVIAVAGLRRDLATAAWSNRGDWVDVSTVAEGLTSTFVLGEETPQATAEDPYDPDHETWEGPNANALWLGTSFATPQVAAWLAQFLAQTGKSATDAKAALLAAAAPGEPGFGKQIRIL